MGEVPFRCQRKNRVSRDCRHKIIKENLPFISRLWQTELAAYAAIKASSMHRALIGFEGIYILLSSQMLDALGMTSF